MYFTEVLMETHAPNQPISEETSRRITSLRFLLAVLVVFIHNNFTAESIAKTFEETGRTIPFCQNAFGQWVQLFISGGIARCAVPLFFLFAAFLQGVKNDPYPVLLKKKAKSLALPYALWMAVYVLYFGVLKLVVAKIAPQVLAHQDKTMLTMTMRDWAESLIGFYSGTGDGNPRFAMQFWFVRDLMIFTAVSPVLIKLIRKFPVGVFFCASVFYLSASISFDAHANYSVFFYIVGLYWGIFNFALFEKIDTIGWAETLCLFAATFVLSAAVPSRLSGCCATLSACLLLLKFSALISNSRRTFSAADYFSGFSFFLYAIHMPVLNELLKKLWLRFFPMTNTFFSLFEYFGVSVLTVAIGTGIGIALKKICPPLFTVLNGGRK